MKGAGRPMAAPTRWGGLGRKTVELCTPCLLIMLEERKYQLAEGGVNKKITCERCERRRYGAIYEEVKS